MSKKPFVIGIAGSSGSGKTFFLKSFLNHFEENKVCLLSQDDYYHRVSHNMTPEENKLYNFDLPSTIDNEQFISDIKNPDILDLKIFIDTDEEVALKRRLKRDLIERGYPESDVLYKWENHVVPAYKDYLLPHRELCDLIIKNNTHVAADINKITSEISEKLKKSVFAEQLN